MNVRLVPAVMLPLLTLALQWLRDRLKSYENGANSFVSKPVDFADFAETVARLGVYWLTTNEPPPMRSSYDE